MYKTNDKTNDKMNDKTNDKTNEVKFMLLISICFMLLSLKVGSLFAYSTVGSNSLVADDAQRRPASVSFDDEDGSNMDGNMPIATYVPPENTDFPNDAVIPGEVVPGEGSTSAFGDDDQAMSVVGGEDSNY